MWEKRKDWAYSYAKDFGKTVLWPESVGRKTFRAGNTSTALVTRFSRSQSKTAHGNLSTKLRTSIFCNLTIFIWMSRFFLISSKNRGASSQNLSPRSFSHLPQDIILKSTAVPCPLYDKLHEISRSALRLWDVQTNRLSGASNSCGWHRHSPRKKCYSTVIRCSRTAWRFWRAGGPKD